MPAVTAVISGPYALAIRKNNKQAKAWPNSAWDLALMGGAAVRTGSVRPALAGVGEGALDTLRRCPHQSRPFFDSGLSG